MSFFKKFQKNRKLSESGSIGSTLSIQSIGTNKGLLNTTYSVNEKELPSFLKAIWINDVRKVKKMMKKEYNSIDNEKRSGLHLACAMGSEEMVRELLGNYCNELLEKKDNVGRTGLFKAVEAGSVECVRLLLEKGAKTDVKDISGDTVVHAAVRHKQFEVLRYLLEARCNGSQHNIEGLAPLHLAASTDYVAGVDILLQHNVDVDQLTSTGKSALILAAESGNCNVIKELLSRNAEISIKDSDGKDAYYYADFHEYSECAQQLQSVSDYFKHKTPPRKSMPLQMPEFIVSQSPDSRELLGSNSKPSPKSIIQDENSKDARKKEIVKPEDLKKRSPEKKERRSSLKSENSWSEDYSHYSSDNTLPNKSNIFHDISTPSSMPNPSEDRTNPLRPLSNGVTKNHINKQHSDDEESQWTDTEGLNEVVDVPIQRIKNNLGSQVMSVKKEDVIQITKNDDSDWDSNTDNDKDEPDGILSTIDEESGAKQPTRKSSGKHSKKTKMLRVDDGHQTDSNIEDCYNTNYMFLNKPVRYDSCETLDDDDDDDTELSQTKIVNPNYREGTSAPFTKPPVSPMIKGDNLPVITIEEPSIRGKVAANAGGDNLSYSSTDLSSRRDSLAGSDNQADFDKNSKFTAEYIKKCSNMESKLRIMESEKDILQQDIKRANESKKKLDGEKALLQKDYQKIEVMLSEKKDELDELKSRFVSSEELLKTREKELFEMKKANQDLSGNLNEKEMKNIAYDSKIKQLQHEIMNLQTELQRSSHSEKDVEYHKSQYETERDAWLKRDDVLNEQISDLRHQMSKLQMDSDKIIAEHESIIKNGQSEIKELKKTLEVIKEDDTNRIEEIEQLKKTINNLNADLESSNKSAALVAKEENKNKNLNEQLKMEEKKMSDLRNEIQILKKQIADTDQSFNRTKQEIDKLRNQMIQKEDNLSQVELKCKSSENQAKDLEKLLESKMIEVKEINKKCLDLDQVLLSERNAKENIVERINLAIKSAVSLCPDSEEVIEQLQNIRKSLNGFDTNHNSMNMTSISSYDDADSSIELSKARSQIRVLQDQLEDVRRDLRLSKDEVLVPRRGLQLQSNDYVDSNYESEMDRVNKIERMEKETQNELKEQTRSLRKTQQQMEMSELNQLLTRAEKDREELIQEIKSMNEQLVKERNLKDSLTEQLVNIIRNPNGSIPQMSGSKEFLFPSTATMNTAMSQWNIPNNVGDSDRKPFSTSMSNLSLLKCNGIEDDELRQRMRKELDRSIAKHLESGRPIRQLNVKDKIRSLNIVRYPSNNIAWKTQ